MKQYEMATVAITQKAQSERLYMHYALALAILLALVGTALVILGIGAHLDIIIGGDNLEARFVNASPGVALWLVAGTVFYVSKPRRLQASASHEGTSDENAIEDRVLAVMDPIMDQARAAILGSIAEARRQIQVELDAAVTFVANERHSMQTNKRTQARETTARVEGRDRGTANVYYQEDPPPREDPDEG